MGDNLEEHEGKMVLMKHGVTTYPAKLVSSEMINGKRKVWIQWDSRKETDCVDWDDILFDLPPRRRWNCKRSCESDSFATSTKTTKTKNNHNKNSKGRPNKTTLYGASPMSVLSIGNHHNTTNTNEASDNKAATVLPLVRDNFSPNTSISTAQVEISTLGYVGAQTMFGDDESTVVVADPHMKRSDSFESFMTDSSLPRNKPNAVSEIRGAAVGDSWDAAIQVKMEQLENVYSGNGVVTERAKRKTNRRVANVNPVTGKGRKVFRRGCHKQRLTTILGGSGMHPSPKVSKPPIVNGFDENPFIKKDEFYIAGRGDWNPWGPVFPGDSGLLASDLIHNEGQQTHFHVFVQCSAQRHQPHYHGKEAREKRLYVGKYKCVPLDSEAEIQETSRTFLYSALGEESKWTMADHFRKHNRFVSWEEAPDEFRTVSSNTLTDAHYTTAVAHHEELWDAMSEEK
eukprot:scaffold35594_cov57-Attheya_sp.AAC.1